MLEQLGQHDRIEIGPHLRVAEEPRDVDEDRVEELDEFFLVQLEEIEILVERGNRHGLHAPLHTGVADWFACTR